MMMGSEVTLVATEMILVVLGQGLVRVKQEGSLPVVVEEAEEMTRSGEQ